MSMIGELEKLLAMDNWRPNLNGINYTNSEGQCPDKHFLCHQKHSDHLLNTIRSEFRMFHKTLFFSERNKKHCFCSSENYAPWWRNRRLQRKSLHLEFVWHHGRSWGFFELRNVNKRHWINSIMDDWRMPQVGKHQALGALGSFWLDGLASFTIALRCVRSSSRQGLYIGEERVKMLAKT